MTDHLHQDQVLSQLQRSSRVRNSMFQDGMSPYMFIVEQGGRWRLKLADQFGSLGVSTQMAQFDKHEDAVQELKVRVEAVGIALDKLLRVGIPHAVQHGPEAEGLLFLASVIDSTQRAKLNHFLTIQKLDKRHEQFATRQVMVDSCRNGWSVSVPSDLEYFVKPTHKLFATPDDAQNYVLDQLSMQDQDISLLQRW